MNNSEFEQEQHVNIEENIHPIDDNNNNIIKDKFEEKSLNEKPQSDLIEDPLEEHNKQIIDNIIQNNDIKLVDASNSSGINNNNTTNENENNENHHENKKVSSDVETLDEPIIDTFKRDLLRICYKLKNVIIPSLNARKKEELQNWDLWGPLLFCLLLATALSTSKSDTGKGFLYVFIIVWIGSIILTFNCQFLGAKIGICQMSCLLGYCLFPITLAAIIIALFKTTKAGIKVLITGICCVWSCFSSIGFISSLVSPNKKMIAVFPIFLFYLCLTLFVINY
jgi:hypothetical protein